MTSEELLHITRNYPSPLYVYDATQIREQYYTLKTSFQDIKKVKFNYAVKALSNLHILHLMMSLGSGLDTVSIEEIQLGILAGFKPRGHYFYSKWCIT